ncbi:hypothetical protein [Prosthecomicrobium pneumaticum]|uniref:Uncharacterized protein n=1 Tax=Prosthecomicrobium pneumaticum TaxID=81895 RepID=A0A7W9FIZ6_9HYPH|nr:hypothetical protein [Prosthecomicrobium pneumaticum]MBB5751031.1 hypothetical protein [Prosthecomicrobium pneumaticum]
MIFSPAEALLFAALVMTSVCVVLMQRRLRALAVDQGRYRAALDDSTVALLKARAAVGLVNDDSRDLLVQLCRKIEEAEAVLWRLDRAGKSIGRDPEIRP